MQAWRWFPGLSTAIDLLELRTREAMKKLTWDVVAVVTFTAVAMASYLGWAAVNYEPWICYTSAVVVVAGLAVWARWLWPRLALGLTKFFCVAATFDLLMEGFLHPIHPETPVAKLTCELSLFGVYAIYIILRKPLQPLDLWLTEKIAAAFRKSRAVISANWR
jgi:hypothetical protein